MSGRGLTGDYSRLTVVRVVSLVVHDELVVDKVEAIGACLIRVPDHLLDCRSQVGAGKVSSSQIRLGRQVRSGRAGSVWVMSGQVGHISATNESGGQVRPDQMDGWSRTVIQAASGHVRPHRTLTPRPTSIGRQ